MSIGKQIESMINTMTDNNIPTKLITIIKGYDTEICDISAENGIIKNVPCSTSAKSGDKGLLVYLDGDANKPFVLLFNSGGGGDLSDYVRKNDLLDKTKYDIDLNLNFGLKGQDDTIVIDMDIVDHIVNKDINI